MDEEQFKVEWDEINGKKEWLLDYLSCDGCRNPEDEEDGAIVEVVTSLKKMMVVADYVGVPFDMLPGSDDDDE